MYRRRRHSARFHSSAFTLFELLLVLAVMVAVGAVAIPGIFGVLANRQLARGGNGLRVAMVQARLEAMRTGRTQVMRCEIGGSRFQVAPHYTASDVTEAGDMIGRGTAVASGGIGVPVLPDAATGSRFGGELPEADGPRDMLSVSNSGDQLPDLVLFSDAQVQATARSATVDQASGGAMTADSGWSQPILFYADGTTSTAAVVLTRAEVGRVIVRLRGLTGESMVSEVMP